MKAESPDSESENPTRIESNKLAMRTVGRNIHRYAVAIVDTDTLALGTGTLVRIAGRLFVATASHVIPAHPRGRLCIVAMGKQELKSTSLLGFAKSPGNQPDVGFLEVGLSLLGELQKEAITLDRFSVAGTGDPTRGCWLLGYPSEQVGKTKIGPQEGLLSMNAMGYCFIPKSPCEWPSPPGGASPANPDASTYSCSMTSQNR